jgi:hypothetical protein
MLGAGEIQIFAQNFEQRFVYRGVHITLLAIYDQMQNLFHRALLSESILPH